GTAGPGEPGEPGDASGPRLPATLRRTLDGMRWLRELSRRPRVRPWLFAATALVFVILAVASFRSLPDEGRDARPELFAVLVLVTTPATLTLNALEYRFMGSTLGHRIGFRHAMRVSLVASIANYLPAPGGVAVRTAALKRRGSTVRSAVSINAVVGLVWAGATGLIAGGAMIADDRLAGRAAAATVAGFAALVVAVVWLRRGGDGWPRRFRQVLLIEVGLVVVSGLRVWIALAAIGQPTPLGASIAISTSTVLAALLGIFPAGLGLRELLAGGIAAAVEVPAAAAVAATAVDRIASQIGMAVTALALGLRRGDLAGGGGEGDEGDDGDVPPAPAGGTAAETAPGPGPGPTPGWSTAARTPG
ncbi:MAG TPA: lysylphosphatidylglycerol synthase domain-containing protein, partial [Acidimicrobiales bacterium]